MKLILVRGLFVLFGTSLALGIGEISVRYLLPPVPSVLTTLQPSNGADAPNQVHFNKPAFLESRVDQGSALYVHTPSGKRLRKNAHVIIENHHLCQCSVEIKTNSLGYRGPEIAEKDPNVPRVLFLGDSITFAAYVAEEETWVRRVEKLASENNQPLEAINAGVWAVGLANELAILQETGLSTEPDVVVLAFYLNDYEASPGITLLRPPAYLKYSVLAQHIFHRLSFLKLNFEKTDHSTISHDKMMAWKAQIEEKFPPGKTSHDYRTNPAGFNKLISDLVSDWGGAWSDGVWEHLTPLVAEFKRQAVLNNFKPLIVMFPVENQISANYVYDYPQQKMKALSKKLGIPFFDLLPVIRKADKEKKPEERLFYDWCHHTPTGQRHIAEAVYNFLEENRS